MAKKKKEEVVEETTQETKVNEPKGKETKGDVKKVKAKMKVKPKVIEETVTKVDLNKPIEEKKEEVVEEVKEEVKEETPVVEDVTDEKVDEKVEEVTEKVEEAIAEAQKTGEPLPENIQKLVSFMEETGGDLNDYVKLNQDYSKLDNQDLLLEYYRQTKPHLNHEEINFLMEDNFSYDEDVDGEKDIRRKKLVLKEQVANAKDHLDGLKSKYYDEIKGGSKLSQEQREAIDFYQKTQEEYQRDENITNDFLNKTERFFGDKFKGFEYDIGDKRFRFNVNDASEVKKTQRDISNFVGKFLDENQYIKDEEGYHKSLFTAMNADTIANHFYEQGKADAMKDSIAKSKNINMEPRQSLGENVDTGDIKVRVLGDTAPDYKFKLKQK